MKAVKGSFLLPFFLIILSLFARDAQAQPPDAAWRAADAQHLYSDPTWLALLHIVRGRCQVTDSTFLLHNAECSPQEEMRLLLTGILNGGPSAQDLACRFPARVEFLRARLSATGINIPVISCSDLQEYFTKAPADNVELVFASENITHPMSMMGHVFLKFSGRDGSGKQIEHAISFFTRFSALNIPRLVADSLFLGMPSYFSLTPYTEHIDLYREREKRNIWEYSLKINDQQRTLIQLHVWELRFVKTPYFLAGYNCATVVYFLVALADPTMLEELGWWITPIDVVRAAYARGMITGRVFIPSVDWELRTYHREIGSAAAVDVIDKLKKGDIGEIKDLEKSKDGPIKIAFASAVLERERTSPHILYDLNPEALAKRQDLLANISIPPLVIENPKDPVSGPKSSRFTTGYTHFNGAGNIKLEFVPASHSLSDDNRRSYSESMLELGSTSLLYNPSADHVTLERFNLYGMKSLVPNDTLVGGLSSRLVVGVEQQWSKNLSPFTAGHTTVGLGKTVQVGDDAWFYGLLNVAANYGGGGAYLSYFPEGGAILYEVFSMKTLVNYRLVCGQHSENSCYQRAGVTQAFIPAQDFSPYLSFNNLWNNETSSRVWEAGVKIYF